ncbi:MAG TPA: GNAT family N-acetyltransferase [Nocardioides sp.]|nr:GNAT family N-acetyltransferase [Nocardioides sp.]
MTTPRLTRITPDNLDAVCAVRIREEQEPYVEAVARSLAEAYVHPDLAWPRAIFDGDACVGFVMAFLDVRWNDDDPPEITRSGLWRLNIDAAHQGHGYGRFAVDAVCAHLTERGRDEFVYVTWEPGEHGPEAFYLGLGFEPTGELSGKQTVARRRL